jgi:hypothetical protein
MDTFEKLDSKDLLTVILVTINPEKIQRFLSHHKNSNIIIVNGGSRHNSNEIGNANYIHMPNTTYFERLNYGLGITKTIYSMIAGDDEFFNEKLIEKSIKENNSSTMIFGRVLEHDGLFYNSFVEQYRNNPIDIKKLNINDSNNVDTYLSLIKEDTIYWYSAIKTNVLKNYSKKFKLNSEMAEFEIMLPYYVLNQQNAEIKFIDGIWMKRVKYTRVSKPSNLIEFKNISLFTPMQRLAIESKKIYYQKSRGKKNNAIFILNKTLRKKILIFLNKLKLIRINYKFDV